MIVSKIEPQKKYKNRFSVYIDDKFAFGISDFDLHRLQIKEGSSIDPERLESIRQNVLIQDAKQYALKLLDTHAYTENNLRRKLTDHGTEPAACEAVLNFLKDYGYIDDAAYARRYISAAIRSGKSGMKKIEYDLTVKGVPRELVQEISTEFDADETDLLIPLIQKRLKGDFSFENKMKIKRYCLSRGFSYEEIELAMRKLTANKEEDF